LLVNGEIDPKFAEDFKDELGPHWNIMNFDSIFSHVLTYNKNLMYPLLTDSWFEMRGFFKFSDFHQFSLIFLWK
jgi:hypothetical protein